MLFTNSLEIIEILLTIWICFNKNINYALLKSFKACYTIKEIFHSNNGRVIYFFYNEEILSFSNGYWACISFDHPIYNALNDIKMGLSF